MKINTNLFIGGSSNGRRISNEGQPRIVVPTIAKFRAVPEGDGVPLKMATANEEVYERERMRVEGNGAHIDFIFYRHSKLPLPDALDLLFKHYRP